jgi:hemerythrin-like domain-containing protein
MTTATEVLKEEHHTIKAMLELMERVAEKTNQGQQLSPEVMANLMEFIRLFIDQCHHSKEEEILFPSLEKKGVPAAGGPLGVMLMEHDRARVLIHEMNAETASGCSSPASLKRWTRAAWDYSDLMYEHFHKEEEILFRMADRVLSSEQQASMVKEFDQLANGKTGPRKHAQLRTMMEELIAAKL